MITICIDEVNDPKSFSISKDGMVKSISAEMDKLQFLISILSALKLDFEVIHSN
jgi:hypothetical protein